MWIYRYGVAYVSRIDKLYVSFAKEPYKRDYILPKRSVNLLILLIVATPQPSTWYQTITDSFRRYWALVSRTRRAHPRMHTHTHAHPPPPTHPPTHPHVKTHPHAHAHAHAHAHTHH